MAANLSYWTRLERDWFTREAWEWDAWVLRAYRRRIDFQSFVEKGTEITEALKDDILHQHRAAILKAIYNQEHEKPVWKTIFHYAGKLAVFLLATSSAFVLSLMVGSHFRVGAAWAAELLSWGIFTFCFLAHKVIFGELSQLAEKLCYKERGKTWHFFENRAHDL